VKLSQRDKRALVLLGMAVVVVIIFRAATATDAAAVKVVAPSEQPVDALELNLRRLRQSMARVPGKTTVLKQVSDELAVREKGLFVGDTVNQAQAQIAETVKKVARTAGMEIRATDFSPVKPFGDAYGEVGLTISAECTIEQLVNLMADLANQPQLIATNELRMNAANPKQKTVNIRLTITGLVPKRLVPEKKA
jgi:hypothetical protein